MTKLNRAWVACVVAILGGCNISGQGRSGAQRSSLSAAQCDYFDVDGKVQICHANGSSKKPYTILKVSEQGCINGHTKHADDYIASGDPTCHGGGCLPAGAPCDPTLPCCDGLACTGGVCEVVDAGAPDPTPDANAGPVRDQYNPSTGSFVGLQADQHVGQSFAVGRSGRLTAIAIPMFRFGAAVPGDLVTLTIFACSASDTCSSTPLGTASIPTDSLAATFPSGIPALGGAGSFDLSAIDLHVTAGEIYRVRLDPPAGQSFGVLDSTADDYLGGVAFSQLSAAGEPFLLDPLLDLAFATYVSN